MNNSNTASALRGSTALAQIVVLSAMFMATASADEPAAVTSSQLRKEVAELEAAGYYPTQLMSGPSELHAAETRLVQQHADNTSCLVSQPVKTVVLPRD